MTLFRHRPHPRIAERHAEGAVKISAHLPRHTSFARFNTTVGLRITAAVGTMICAYIFTGIALVSLPSALSSGNLTVIIAWLSSNFLQLVLLAVIGFGQNAQATAADARAEATYKDAEAVLHECMELQRHLAAQDEIIQQIYDRAAGTSLASEIRAAERQAKPHGSI